MPQSVKPIGCNGYQNKCGCVKTRSKGKQLFSRCRSRVKNVAYLKLNAFVCMYEENFVRNRSHFGSSPKFGPWRDKITSQSLL